MQIKFEGFNPGHQLQLESATRVLKEASGKASGALLAGELTFFSKWFDGTGSNAHLMKIATIVKEIDDAISNRPITFVNATGNSVDKEVGGLCGYVFLIRNKGPGDQFADSIHVGSGMRIMMVPKTHKGDINDLAETMYHELSHKVGGTTDLSYDVDVCLDWAKTDTQQAALNAENYNRFLGEYI